MATPTALWHVPVGAVIQRMRAQLLYYPPPCPKKTAATQQATIEDSFYNFHAVQCFQQFALGG